MVYFSQFAYTIVHGTYWVQRERESTVYRVYTVSIKHTHTINFEQLINAYCSNDRSPISKQFWMSVDLNLLFICNNFCLFLKFTHTLNWLN